MLRDVGHIPYVQRISHRMAARERERNERETDSEWSMNVRTSAFNILTVLYLAYRTVMINNNYVVFKYKVVS